MARNVVDILKRIRERSLNPKEISIFDRRLCVAYLRHEGYTQEEIAQVFGVSRQTIIRDEKAIRRELAKLVDEIDVKSYAGELIASARHIKAKALRKKEYSLAWNIERGLLSDLQSLGYLPRSPEKHQVQVGTFLDLVQMATKQVDSTVIEPGANSKHKLPPVRNSRKAKRANKLKGRRAAVRSQT